MTEKGGTCPFLGKECCYYANQSSLLQGKIAEITTSIEKWRQQHQTLSWSLLEGVWPWLLPLIGPLIMIFLLALIGPCLFNLLQWLLQENQGLYQSDHQPNVCGKSHPYTH
jgi:hypothetical protein